MNHIADIVFNGDNARFFLSACFGAFMSFITLFNQVNKNEYEINRLSESNELLQNELKVSLKELNNEIVEIKLMLARQYNAN